MKQKIEIITVDNIGFPSPFTHRIEILAKIKNIDYSIINVDLYNKPKWFLDIAPLGQVPLMKIDKIIIADSKAICEYLDSITDQPLLPIDPLEKAQHNSWWALTNELAQEITKIVKTPELKISDLKHINHLFSVLDKSIQAPYFFGKKLSMVDISLIAHMLWFDALEKYVYEFSIIAQYPKLSKWFNHVRQLKVVAETSGKNFAKNFIEHIKMRGYIK